LGGAAGIGGDVRGDEGDACEGEGGDFEGAQDHLADDGLLDDAAERGNGFELGGQKLGVVVGDFFFGQ